jgi:hypothetical protein
MVIASSATFFVDIYPIGWLGIVRKLLGRPKAEQGPSTGVNP